jgi:hypothetical protein
VAVGNGPGKVGDFAEVWNGKAWIATGPIAWPKGATRPWVDSVSCVTASYCVAVGYIDRNPQVNSANTGRAAASVWNGKTWTAAAVAAPGKGKASLFNDVKCLRTTFCVAVGQIGPYGSAKDGAVGVLERQELASGRPEVADREVIPAANKLLPFRAGQPSPQLVHSGHRDVSFQGAPGVLGRRYLRDGAASPAPAAGPRFSPSLGATTTGRRHPAAGSPAKDRGQVLTVSRMALRW